MKQFFGKKSRSMLASVIMVSLLLHVVAIAIFGTIKFVTAMREEEKVFEAPPIAPPPQKEPEYTVNLQQRSRDTPPPRPPTIVVNNPSELDIPALDIDVNIDSTSVYGRGGGGFGGGLASLREMALTNFGYTGMVAGALEGTLIDLKHDDRGKRLIQYRKDDQVEWTVGNYAKAIIRDFADSSWDIRSLERKYKSAEAKLYSTFFMIPFGFAREAPKAFNAAKEIDAKAVVAVYNGTFTPRESGRFRFAGRGDDVLIVRADRHIVLDASIHSGYSKWDQKGRDTGPASLFSSHKGLKLIYGDWINLRAGTPVNLDVMIAETPGGHFYAFLLFQKEGGPLKLFSTKPLSNSEKQQLRKVHRDANQFIQ